MTTAPPLMITVYDKNYNRKGVVAAPESVSIQLVWNAPGRAEFTVPASHARVNSLATPGSRCTFDYRLPDGTWKRVLSGLVFKWSGSGSVVNATRTFEVRDDLHVLNKMLAFQVPENFAVDQADAAYDVRTGPLETIIKGVVTDNNVATKAGSPARPIPHLTIEADSATGPTKTIKFRMHNVAEKILTAATNNGLGVRIVQSGTSRELQTWTPATYPRVLTEESGIVRGADFSYEAPEVTSIVAGGQGEGTLRDFWDSSITGFHDPTAEAAWGEVYSEFIDARDISSSDPAGPTNLARERAQERLEEGAAKASLRAELAETGRFRYGIAFDLGDKVSVRPAGEGSAITDRVREVHIDWTASDGLVVTPLVGEWQDSQTDRLYRVVRKSLKAINDLGTR